MKYYNDVRALLLVTACACGFLMVTPGCAATQESANEDEHAAAEEEVEVGYGTKNRGATTGALSTVSGEEARRQRQPTRLSDLIEGNVAGVSVAEAPGGGIQVRIRGTSSILGSNEPLYVVDGMPVEPDPGGTLSSVNPYDVASITVLKDAAATSIYGARGANGVIIVETRMR